MITLDELRADVDEGAIDTVVVAFTDMQGRLLGKRMHAEFFLEESVEHGIEGCNYLLALEMEMDPVPGYEIASWERGYGDFRIDPRPRDAAPDPVARGHRARARRRRLARRLAGPALAAAGAEGAGRAGGVARATGRCSAPSSSSTCSRTRTQQAHAKHYRDLTPSVPYILDYHVLATTYDEPFIRQLRNGMHAAGIKVENSKGEAWPGQQEINFRFADAVTMADNHVIYKNGAKELAHLNGMSITFMAKPDHTWIGNSCHIHGSLWRGDEAAFTDDAVFGGWLAGWIEHTKELAVFLAPNVNSYKRYAAGSWAPTTLAWGKDNRTCGFRIVGHGRARRVETRIPGGDVNPYLAFAALIAAGLDGVERGLEPPPALEGNAYESDAERFPHTLREATAALEQGTFARGALGDDVVDHYLNYARTEQRLFDEVVTCYERERLFERG